MFPLMCDPEEDDHLFVSEVPAEMVIARQTMAMFPDDLTCACGAFTWGEMNRRLEEREQLEAMWRR